MSTNSMIKYLAIGRQGKPNTEVKTHELLAERLTIKTDPNAITYKENCTKLTERADRLGVNKRARLNSQQQDYNVHVYVDHTGSHPIVFLALTSTDFGNHYNLDVFCSDFRNEFFNRVPVAQVGDSSHSLATRCKAIIDTIYNKYSASSALQNATKQAGLVKDAMRENISMALANIDKLDDLDDRAQNLEASAKIFQSNANKVERRMCRDYWTTKIIIIFVILAIIGIVVGVYFGTKK